MLPRCCRLYNLNLNLTESYKQHFFDRRWRSLKTYEPIAQTRVLSICTLISENQGLKKSRSISNLGNFSGLQTLIFFSRSQPWKKSWVYTINLKEMQFPNLKKTRFAVPEIFLGFDIETLISQDLDFHKSGCRLKGWNRPDYWSRCMSLVL